MMINSNRSLEGLTRDVQKIFGEFFSKKILKELCKTIQNNGEIDLQVVREPRIITSDAVFIKEIKTDFADCFVEEIDVNYDVLEGDVIPGIIKQTVKVRKGSKVERYGSFNGALLSKSNSLIYKKKTLKKRNLVVNRNLVYALVF